MWLDKIFLIELRLLASKTRVLFLKRRFQWEIKAFFVKFRLLVRKIWFFIHFCLVKTRTDKKTSFSYPKRPSNILDKKEESFDTLFLPIFFPHAYKMDEFIAVRVLFKQHNKPRLLETHTPFIVTLFYCHYHRERAMMMIINHLFPPELGPWCHKRAYKLAKH